MNCHRCGRPNAKTDGTDGSGVCFAFGDLDCERAKIARLESELAAERARADAAEREQAANGAALRTASQQLATAFAAYCKSRPGDESHHIAIREFYGAGYALDEVLAAAPSPALARIQGLVESAALDAFVGTTTPASNAALPCWLVWRMDDPAKGVYLVAVDTSPEIADRHKRAFEAEAEMMNRWRRVIVEESRLDHAFGESISKDLPRTGTNTGDGK